MLTYFCEFRSLVRILEGTDQTNLHHTKIRKQPLITSAIFEMPVPYLGVFAEKRLNPNLYEHQAFREVGFMTGSGTSDNASGAEVVATKPQ